MKVFQSLVKTIAVIFAGIFTFLISLTILFAGMSLELKPTRENKNPEGNFDDSYIRSSSEPSIIRTLTVSPQLKPKERIDDKSIKHSNDLGSVWGPDKSLSISGFQNVDSVGYFSVSIFGIIIVDTESQKGEKPSQLPKGWEFSGTGNYNVNYCTYASKLKVEIKALPQSQIVNASNPDIQYFTFGIKKTDSISILINKIKTVGMKNGGWHAAFDSQMSEVNSNIELLKTCNVCKNTSNEIINVKYDFNIDVPLLHLPDSYVNDHGTMGVKTETAFNTYYEGRKKHEMIHFNNYLEYLKSIKTCDGNYDGCKKNNESEKNIKKFKTDINNYLSEMKTLKSDFNKKEDNYDMYELENTNPIEVFLNLGNITIGE